MIENAGDIEPRIRYADQQGNEFAENKKEEKLSEHFSTEILKRVSKLPFVRSKTKVN